MNTLTIDSSILNELSGLTSLYSKGCYWTEDKSGNYSLLLEMPGVSKENAKFTVKSKTLRVEGKSDISKYDSEFCLPKDADPSKCRVSLKDGLATVTICKLESHQPRQIDIE